MAAVDTAIPAVIKDSAELREQFDAADAKLQALAEQIDTLRTADALPEEFFGIIHNYRYGMTSVVNDGLPQHQFEVEGIDGLWLAVIVGSEVFDPFVKECGITTMDPEAFNGQVVQVRRNASYRRLVPVKLLRRIAETDGRGNALFIGARVRSDEGFYGTVVADTPNVAIKRDDGITGGGPDNSYLIGASFVVRLA